jgi:hypothetical protein
MQTIQTGGQWYGDTSPFSISWLMASCHIHAIDDFLHYGTFLYTLYPNKLNALNLAYST